jgi:hypothetical protein
MTLADADYDKIMAIRKQAEVIVDLLILKQRAKPSGLRAKKNIRCSIRQYC